MFGLTGFYEVAAKALALLILVAAIFGAGYFKGNAGKEASITQMAKDTQKIIDDQKAAYDKATLLANGLAAVKTAENKASIDLLTSQLMEVQNAKDIEIQKLRDQARINRGANGTPNTGGLSLAGASCAPGSGTTGNLQAGGDPGAVAGTGNKEECRLSEETANTLISIVSDGDKAINQLNKTIDAYNSVRIKGCGVESKAPATSSQPKTVGAVFQSVDDLVLEVSSVVLPVEEPVPN